MPVWFVRLIRKANDMRELTLLDTGYLAGGLLLCLVLPMVMSFRGPMDEATKRSCMKIVWPGQMLLAIAGLTLLTSSILAPYAAGFGAVSCITCASLLLGCLRTVRTA